MTRPILSHRYDRRASDERFPRREPLEFARLPWRSRPPLVPDGINWAVVFDAAFVLSVLLLALLAAVGAIH